ncbi:MAG: hypothetical protein DI564_06200 [Rhodanobacter denitrificans]|uniref:Uncharacterized protein n=1 Tax=Rhodanobacter denitrificans TaxID=666685 RepID=A0A2W5KRK3_9GAMM|nr:MAG: hypothetical protein DI564_06200 [Rhodanobacter denitrificans]
MTWREAAGSMPGMIALTSPRRLLGASAPLLLAVALTALITTSRAHAAEQLVASVPGADFDVGATPVVQTIAFDATVPISGVGFTARWTAVVADEENGLAPWSLDLAATITAPDGSSTLSWPRFGGDRTYADYPLQDYIAGFADVAGSGDFQWRFTSVGPPWVAGLRDVTYHLTTRVDNVVGTYPGSVASGPTWSRPYYIGGISGLGPVVYQATAFEVPVSGGYYFESVVAQGDHFLALYQDAFDPAQPLANLLDYEAGNGSSPNGPPRGTARISALLFAGRSYHLVASQWSASAPGQSYVTTVTGPAALILAGDDTLFADGFE